VVRSLPSDQSLDHDEGGNRLFDYSRVTEELIVGRIPRFKEDLVELRDQHSVSAVISMSEDWELQERGWEQDMVASTGLKWLQLATPDYSAPRMRDLIKAVQVSQISAGTLPS